MTGERAAAALSAAISTAAREGVLIKGGGSIEALTEAGKLSDVQLAVLEKGGLFDKEDMENIRTYKAGNKILKCE